MRNRFVVLSAIPLLFVLLFIPYTVDYYLAKNQKEPKFAKKLTEEMAGEEYVGVGYSVLFTEGNDGETIVHFDSLLIDFVGR